MDHGNLDDGRLIDETFKGLSNPTTRIDVGRPDITIGRPGDLLVAAVRTFEAEGGFERLRIERDAARIEANAPDTRLSGAPDLLDLVIPTTNGDAVVLDIADE